MVSMHARHFIIWLVALTILVVVIAMSLYVVGNRQSSTPAPATQEDEGAFLLEIL